MLELVTYQITLLKEIFNKITFERATSVATLILMVIIWIDTRKSDK
ncbi:hypothetical protein CMUST_01045 [Corynebacterium mustelae]|uniref:Uncharacterized protein n=1 Tax=Corynebacterium mustelae TaxID=571915 RepID=A0A0G3GTV3_9CORY|nr:hypothetical protein [Corynebacterium mustelae]AKK04559.1 hypothetical protein CMUST_01045 [Corynebacterium mustelae]